VQPSALEQELFELVNRARMDPGGEFSRLVSDAARGIGVTPGITRAIDWFDVDLAALAADLAARPAVAPVAWNAALARAADSHSTAMIAADLQAHQLPGGPSPDQRLAAAGYGPARAWGENVFAYAQDPIYAHAGFIIDWGYGPGGMQDPAGHRNTILNGRYTELGVAALTETDRATQVGPLVVTQDFATRAGVGPVLVGVVIADADGDRFYDAGEGLGGVAVTITGAGGTWSTTTWAAGGYQIALTAGSYSVTFSGGGLPGSVMQSVTIGAVNVKLDARADQAVAGPSLIGPSLVGTSGSDKLTGDKIDEVIRALAGDDWITPGAGSDSIDGGAGIDMLNLVDLVRGATVDMSAGIAISGADTDRFTGIENLTGTIFADHITGNAGANRLRGLGDYDWFVGSGGGDSYEGGSGQDAVAYSAATAGVRASLAAGAGQGGQARGDLYAGIERLTGSSHADSLTGDAGRNVLRGLGGADTLAGGSGHDRIDGGSGWDIAVYLGDRADYARWTGADSALVVTDRGGSGEGTDRLFGIEVLRFADGDMIL